MSCALTRSISETVFRMPLVMNVKNDLWLPTLLIRCCFAFLRMRGREVTCLSAFFPARSCCQQICQQNFVKVLGTTILIHPSTRCLDHMFMQNSGIAQLFLSNHLELAQNICWSAFITLLKKRVSKRTPFNPIV